MPMKFKNPRILLLKGALGHSAVGLSSFNSMEEEMDYLKSVIDMAESCHPNLVLVEKSVSRDVQESLLAKGVTLVYDMKLPRLRRIAQCTGSPIISSADILMRPKLRQCNSFHIEKFVEEHDSSTEGGKRPTKALMFLEGCPKPLGCTVLLKGAHSDELKKVKHLMRYTVFAAYHFILENSFFADQRAVLTDMSGPKYASIDKQMPVLSLATPNSIVYDPEGSVKVVAEIQKTDDAESVLEPQSILVLFSSCCVTKQIVCEQSYLSRIKYYGNFDMSLGRLLRNILLNQKHSCSSCGEPPESHIYCYTHQNGNLTVRVRRLPRESILPGEAEEKIWMWSRCLKCERGSEISKSTRRVVMSSAAGGLSFGKFLELSFSSHSATSRLSRCGHSLLRDSLRFFGLGSRVVMFRYYRSGL